MRAILALGAAASLWFGSQPVGAASLRVSPTAIEMVAPGRAAILRLRNDADNPIHVQLRVFRWAQRAGVETLEPATDIVASPPTTKLNSGVDYVVRLIRTGNKPLRSEESFRVLVDEIPLRSARRAGTVNMVIRHSIPIFVRPTEVEPPKLSWNVGTVGSSLLLTGQNSGQTRLKIHDLQLVQGSRTVADLKGLVGYVLGGSTMTFKIGAPAKLASGPVRLRAKSSNGPIETVVHVQGR